MKRWSKLQKELYLLICPEIEFQIHCVRYPMRSQYGSESLPRYWITIGKEIIWDYPKDFIGKNKKGDYDKPANGEYPYINEASDISDLIREYIDTPKDDLLEKVFEYDKWGFTDIVKAADRRLGTGRIKIHFGKTEIKAIIQIIAIRNKTIGLEERAIRAKAALAKQGPVSLEKMKAQAEKSRKHSEEAFARDAPKIQKGLKELTTPLSFNDTVHIYKWLYRKQITLEMLPGNIREEFLNSQQYQVYLARIGRQK